MQNAHRLTLAEMGRFVAASGSLIFSGASRQEIYGFVERTLQAQQYLQVWALGVGGRCGRWGVGRWGALGVGRVGGVGDSHLN